MWDRYSYVDSWINVKVNVILLNNNVFEILIEVKKYFKIEIFLL